MSQDHSLNDRLTDGLNDGHVDEPSASECAAYLDRIVYFLDNELDDADCVEVRLHLDSCNPCLVRYDLQRTVKQIVARSCSESAPSELRERVLVRLREVRVQITEY